MIRDHYLFIIIASVFIFLIIGITISSMPEITGYYIRDVMFCEPMTCSGRGLDASGRFYCDAKYCYRDCYQASTLIEMATFCEKELKQVE